MRYPEIYEILSITGLTCRQTSEETSCSNTPSEITGNEVRMTLNDNMYKSSYIDCPEKPVYASK